MERVMSESNQSERMFTDINFADLSIVLDKVCVDTDSSLDTQKHPGDVVSSFLFWVE